MRGVLHESSENGRSGAPPSQGGAGPVDPATGIDPGVSSTAWFRYDWLPEARRRGDEFDDGTVQAASGDDVMNKARALIEWAILFAPAAKAEFPTSVGCCESKGPGFVGAFMERDWRPGQFS